MFGAGRRWAVWVCLMLGAWGCVDTSSFQGVFREEVQPDPNLAYGQEFALRLDLFEFGDEVGGIVRYHPTRWVAGTEASPYENEPLLCTWTSVWTLQNDGRVRLRYGDYDGARAELVLAQAQDGDALSGEKRCVRGCEGDPTLDQGRALVLARELDADANNTCEQPLEAFVFDLRLEGGVLRGLVNDGYVRQERALTLGMMWVSDSNELQDQRIDEALRVADFESPFAQSFTRWLPPGLIRLGDTVSYVSEEGYEARVILGWPLIFRDSGVLPEEAAGEPLEGVDWERSREALVAEPLLADPDDPDRLLGQAILYVEGDPEDVPPRIARLLRDGTTLSRGYGVYDVVVDAEERLVREVRRHEGNQRVRIYGREPSLYEEPRLDERRNPPLFPAN